MPTNINLGKKLGIAGQTNIQLPSGPPTPPPPFVDNKSFEFDGATSYFNGNFVTYNELDGATKAAFSFWIKPTSSTFRTIFAVGTTATAGEAQILCFADASNRIRVNITDTTNTMSTDIDALQPNYWNHVFIAINFSGPSAIYIDGINKTNTINIGALSAFGLAKGDFYLGEDSNSYQGKFLGLINEFAVWSGQDYINSFGILFNEGLPRDLNNLPLNPIGQATPPPTTWFRCGESSTWDGSKWTMADVNGGYNLQSIGIAGPPTQPSPDVPLFNNKSFVFDGATDYIQTTSTYSEIDSATLLTVSLWIKPATSGVWGILTSTIRNAVTNRFQHCILADTNNRIRLFKSTGSDYTYSNLNVLNIGQWNHIMVCVDLSQPSTSTRGRIFVNNVDETSGVVNLNSTPFDVSIDSLYIGENQNGYLTPFDGNIDEVAIWVGTDLRNDVATIYNGGVPNDLNDNGLTAPTSWYRIGEDSLYNSGPGLWSFPDNGSGGNNGSSLTFPESARVSDVPT